MQGGKIIGGTTGTLKVNGTGGTSASANHQNGGVIMLTVSSITSSITSTGSDIQVTGVGISTNGSMQVDFGVDLDAGAQIVAGGMGKVTVQGTGVIGVQEQAGSTGAGSLISSNGGNVQVTGIATGRQYASEQTVQAFRWGIP